MNIKRKMQIIVELSLKSAKEQLQKEQAEIDRAMTAGEIMAYELVLHFINEFPDEE